VVPQPLKSPDQQPLDVSSQQQQQQQQSPVSFPSLDNRKRADIDTLAPPSGLKNKNTPLPLSSNRRIPRNLGASVDATKLIEKVQTEDRGRIMVAKTKIPSGTLLFELSPQAAICDSESRKKRCGFCLGPLNKSWRDEEEEKEVSQQLESKPWLNHKPSANKEATQFKVVKDECTGCGEIWYCDPENQDQGEDEGAEEEVEKKENVAVSGIIDGYDMNIEGDYQGVNGSRGTIHQNKGKGQEDDKKKEKTATTHRKKSCRDQDWETLHRFECGFLKRLFDPSAFPASTTTLGPDHEKAIARFLQLDPYDRDYCRLLIRILIHRFNELDETEGQNHSSSNHNQQQQPNDHKSSRGPSPFERVMYLVENREKYPDDRLLGPMTDVARILDAFQEHLEVYDRDHQRIAHGSANESSLGNDAARQARRRRYSHRLSLDELLSLVCKEESNSFGLYEYPNWKPTRPYYYDHHHHQRQHSSEEGSGGSSLSAQKDWLASYIDTVQSMNAQEQERYHKEHPDRVPYVLRPGLHQELLSSSPLSSNSSKEQEDFLLLSPVERDRQRQERIWNNPNPKIGYGLAFFIRFDASLFNHSCSPNLYHVASNRNQLLVYTAREIVPGEELNLTYLEFGPGYRLFNDDLALRDGTEFADAEAARVLALERRRKFLKNHFHFDCGCSRCQLELEWKDRLDALKATKKRTKEGLIKNGKLEIHQIKQEEEKEEDEEDNADDEIERGKGSATIQQSAKSIETFDKNGDAFTIDDERNNLGKKGEEEEEEEEEGQDDKDPAVFLREGLMCQRQIINVQNGRLVGGHTENSCYGFYAPPQVLARMKVDQFKDFKYKYEGQRRDPWACVACGHEQQRHQ